MDRAFYYIICGIGLLVLLVILFRYVLPLIVGG